jgi:hypothetical protein
MKVKEKDSIREPTSWLLRELDLIVGFLTLDFDVLDDDEAVQGEKFTFSPEFVRPLPVVPELVEVSEDEEFPPQHRKFRDPPDDDRTSNISYRLVVGGTNARSHKDDVNGTVRAVYPRQVHRVRKMKWADDEISCVTGRVVCVQKP